MPATKNRRELVDQALAFLGVLVPGNAPSDEDVSTVDGYVDAVVDGLESREIISIDDSDAVEPRYFLELATCLAAAASPEFGGAALDVETAEQRLRQMARTGPTYSRMQAEYF
jgi:hypothetical protein